MSLLRTCFLLSTTLLVLICGCGGGDGPTLYDLNGTVSFDGKPLPYGIVRFVPDETKSNSGGAGYAEIVDGKYDTTALGGRGVIGGPHKIRFTGFESKPTDDGADEVAAAEAPPVKMLFRDFEQDHDLPKESGEQNFDIPAVAAGTNVESDDPAARRNGGDP